MKSVKAVRYTAHKRYSVAVDTDLLNVKIKIYDENFDQTGKIFYEGTVGKFIKERNPSEYLVELLTQLKDRDRVSYRLGVQENFIEKVQRT